MGKVTTLETSPCSQAKIRIALRQAAALKRALQAGRAIFHFGPWRHAMRAVIRMARSPRPESGERSFPELQLDSVRLVGSIETDGVAVAGTLPTRVLARVFEIADGLPPGEYGDFDAVPEVRAVIQCDAVMRVVRGYLRAEPELLECNLVIANAENPRLVPAKASQRRFHFDYAGWDSLNLFIYLTDVAEDSGAHQVVTGTHRSRNVWDAARVAVPDEEIEDRFKGRIRTITGPAGTMFFEDTTSFHRRRMHTRRRVLLNILYASHRGWFSKGRLTIKYSDFLCSRDAASHSLAG